MLIGLSPKGGSFGEKLTKLRKLKLITTNKGKWKADLALMGLMKE